MSNSAIHGSASGPSHASLTGTIKRCVNQINDKGTKNLKFAAEGSILVITAKRGYSEGWREAFCGNREPGFRWDM